MSTEKIPVLDNLGVPGYFEGFYRNQTIRLLQLLLRKHRIQVYVAVQPGEEKALPVPKGAPRAGEGLWTRPWSDSTRENGSKLKKWQV